MMGERRVRQEALVYGFSLEEHVPADHLLRSIAPTGRRAPASSDIGARRGRRLGPGTPTVPTTADRPRALIVPPGAGEQH